jgi:L-lactate dehydrogenase complex protein LldE
MPPISVALVQQKVESAMETGAQYIVSTEASCFMNIGGYIERQRLNIKPIHIAQILANF